jgi:hypothetical protein
VIGAAVDHSDGVGSLPRIASETIITVIAAGSMIVRVIYLAVPRAAPAEPVDLSLRDTWRMPPFAERPGVCLPSAERELRVFSRDRLTLSPSFAIITVKELPNS